MNIPAEWLFAALILGLYVHDAVALVDVNEGWLEKGMTGRWTAEFPSRRFTWAGRHVLVPALLRPWRLAYRLAWSMNVDGQPHPGWESATPALRFYQWLAAYGFFVVIVLLPLALVARAGDAAVLGLIGMSYAVVVPACVLVWLDAKRLQLSRSACLKLTLEFVLCPPAIANIARRLSLHAQVQEDFVAACRRLLPQAAWNIAAARMADRLDDQLETLEKGSEEYRVLRRRKESIA